MSKPTQALDLWKLLEMLLAAAAGMWIASHLSQVTP